MISKFSVKKPYTVLVGVILVIVLGVVSFMKTTTDLFPNITLPYVLVMTTYPGASPETVEMVVTSPVESAMATVSNIESISSVSNENYSMVILEFSQSADMNAISLEIRENLDQIKSYWDDSVGNPIIIKMNPDMLPVMIAAVGVDGMDNAQVSDFAQESIVPELESVEGVASVSAVGLLEESVNVIIRAEKIDEVNEKIFAAIDKKMQEAADEIADGKGLPKDVAVMDWCGTGRGPKAAADGHDVILCHHWNCYFDYTQCVKDDPVPYPVGVPPVPVSKVYAFNPLKDIPENCLGRVLGGQCCNWTEWTCTPEELEWKIWPRACAIAENFWTAPKKKDYAEFAKRLEFAREALVGDGVNAAPIAFEDGVYLSPRPKKLKLTLGTLTVPTNVVTAALCTFTKDATLSSGRYAMEIHYDRGISVRHADERGRERALEALKGLARPDGRKMDELSFSCMEVED